MPARLPGASLFALGGVAFAAGLVWLLAGHRFGGLGALRRFRVFDPLARALSRAERSGDLSALRRVAAALMRRDGPTPGQIALLAELDRQIHDPLADGLAPPAFSRRFLDQKSVFGHGVAATDLRALSAPR
jgi:hypothetical protein